ncbi:VPLPA-CTERM sorting domain-containing protein [Meridianimarinicoccus aquatilis]|uniref:Uncharacterized protein n=1 Tax=Meridianimarinicoccus aquatilis TaxID=2552766 RepID=A0A4R6B2P9_9RHOB|nr:VPLPA-CTERM sorting domain-containing protein [Fluviibacterium aquatile]TDL91027.1 hypothetical protein E2L05_01775 [Fluviibacterium aquatile]
MSAGSVSAAILQLLPPPTLTIDGSSVLTGQITVSDFVGYQGTTAFASANPPLVKDVTIGSTAPHVIVDDATVPDTATFDFLMFAFQFDATDPDLPPINAIYASNTPSFIIDLPFSSSTGQFTQVTTTGSRAQNVYYDLAPSGVVGTAPIGLPNVQIASDVWVVFPTSALLLNPRSFQPHGTANVPLPASGLLLFGALAVAAIGARRSGQAA